MRFRVLIACLAGAFAGFLVLSGTASALDPYGRRSILGYTQWQNQQNQQAQQLRQLMRQREVQQLREDQMSRTIDRHMDALKRRQADRDLLRNVRGTGTVDRVLMIPESLGSSARKPQQAVKTSNSAQDRVGLPPDAKREAPPDGKPSGVQTRNSADDHPVNEP